MNVLSQKNFWLSLVGKLQKNKTTNRLPRFLNNAPENAAIYPFSEIVWLEMSGNSCIFAVVSIHFWRMLPLYRKPDHWILRTKYAKSTCGKVSVWKDSRIWLTTLLKLHSTRFIYLWNWIVFVWWENRPKIG